MTSQCRTLLVICFRRGEGMILARHSFPVSFPFQWTCVWRGWGPGSERLQSSGDVCALPEDELPCLAGGVCCSKLRVASRAAASSDAKRVSGRAAGALLVSGRARPPPSPLHTGHFSSFQAISQNIHSYFELIRNACSIRFFSSCPAVRAQVSTLARIHSCTASNSGEAYSMSQSR